MKKKTENIQNKYYIITHTHTHTQPTNTHTHHTHTHTHTHPHTHTHTHTQLFFSTYFPLLIILISMHLNPFLTVDLCFDISCCMN